MWWLLSPAKSLVVAAFVFVPLERLLAERDQPVLRRAWKDDCAIGVLNPCLQYGALLLALSVLDHAAVAAAPRLRAAVLQRAFWQQLLLAMVVGDLGIYVVHRLAHTLPLLWRFHVVHHAAEEMDWLVGVRHHFIDLLLLHIGSLGPVVAIGVSPGAMAACVGIFAWQGWLAHSNVRLSYGLLDRVLVSPHVHHWHHSADRSAYNKNYASLFSFWDALGGTIYLPKEVPERYGVEEALPGSWVKLLWHPFRINRAEQA